MMSFCILFIERNGRDILQITVYFDVIFLINFIVVPSYAKFSSGYTTADDMVALSLDFNINISNVEEYEQITIEASSYERINIEISNIFFIKHPLVIV